MSSIPYSSRITAPRLTGSLGGAMNYNYDDPSMVPPMQRRRVAPTASTQMTAFQPVQPPPVFNPSANSNMLNNAQTMEQQYKAKKFNDWWNAQQPAAPIPGAAPINTASGPPTPDGTPASIPAPSNLSRPSSIAPPAPVNAAANIPALSPAEQRYVGNPSPIGTLRGTFLNRDPGAIPGSTKTVDASAPRDAANLKAIAKQNARNSPEFQRTLDDDPQYQQQEGRIATIRNATAAMIPAQSALNPTPAPTDRDLLTPKDRTALDQKDKFHTDQMDLEKQKLEDARNKQILATYGDVGKYIVSGLTSIGKWWNNSGKAEAAAAKSKQQQDQFEKNFRLRTETLWQKTALQMKKANREDSDIEATRKVVMAHIFGEPTTQPAPESTETDAQAPAATDPTTNLPLGNGQKLIPGQHDRIAAAFLSAAGNDPQKARALAQQHGWSF